MKISDVFSNSKSIIPTNVSYFKDPLFDSMTPRQEEIFRTISVTILAISVISTVVFFPLFCFCGSWACEKSRSLTKVLGSPISRWILIVQICVVTFAFFTSGPFLFLIETTNNIICKIQAVGIQGSFAANIMSFLVLTILMTVREFLPEATDTKLNITELTRLTHCHTPEGIQFPQDRLEKYGYGKATPRHKTKVIMRYLDIAGFFLVLCCMTVMLSFPFFLAQGYGPSPPLRYNYCWLENSDIRFFFYECVLFLLITMGVIFVCYFLAVATRLIFTCRKFQKMKWMVLDEHFDDQVPNIRSREQFMNEMTKTKKDMGRVCERFVRRFFYPVIFMVIWLVPVITRLTQIRNFYLELVVVVCFGAHATLNLCMFILCRPCCCYEVCRRAIQNARERKF